jgi:hypothetical protein
LSARDFALLGFATNRVSSYGVDDGGDSADVANNMLRQLSKMCGSYGVHKILS